MRYFLNYQYQYNDSLIKEKISEKTNITALSDGQGQLMDHVTLDIVSREHDKDETEMGTGDTMPISAIFLWKLIISFVFCS